MGQFEICKKFGEFPEFTAYVDTWLFVKGFYLSVMTALGFYFYPISLDNDDEYPSGEERVKLWEPYNILKSARIEREISHLLSSQLTDPNKEPINETFVMFPDCPGSLFFDTMGVCSGDEKGISSDFGDIKLNVPGLREWVYEYDTVESHGCFDYYWEKGWELALRVRDQLPDNIDLYYMCYDPAHPYSKDDYNSSLPKVIVPRV